jgi:hypothetical protein
MQLTSAKHKNPAGIIRRGFVLVVLGGLANDLARGRHRIELRSQA